MTKPRLPPQQLRTGYRRAGAYAMGEVITMFDAVERLTSQILNAAVGTVELSNVYIGHKLGLYRMLAGATLSSAELAEASSCDERYVREWLQAQAVSGFVTVDGDDLRQAHFGLAAGMREVMLDESSQAYLAPLAQAMAASGRMLPALLAAFRTGKGVAYSDYGAEAIEAQAALNRPVFTGVLVQDWLPAIAGLTDLLSDSGRVASVVDLGCGAGWSTIALAKAYPLVRVVGIDADPASLDLARRNAAEQGAGDRLSFEQRDLTQPFADGRRFDVAFLFECLHDMGYPEQVLRNTRAAMADGGQVIVMDEATDANLIAPTDDPVQRLLANISPLWCLPQGRDDAGADPIGTVMRPSRLRELAAAAGFAGMEIAPIEHPFFRLYRLTT